MSRYLYILVSLMTFGSLMACGIVPHNVRLNHVIYGSTYADKLSALHDEADAGDPVLQNIFAENGDPEKIDTIRAQTWRLAGTATLSYPTKEYELYRGLNEDWTITTTRTISPLGRYEAIDTVEAYQTYLTTYPADSPEDLARAKARIAQLQAKENAVAKMNAFVAKNGGNGSVEAYRRFLKQARLDDPAREVAKAKIDDLEYATASKSGSREVLLTYAKTHPASSHAVAITSSVVQSEAGVKALHDAVDALEDLQTAVGVGLNMSDYGRRVADTKIATKRALERGGSAIPSAASSAVTSAMGDYESALEVWNWKLENVGLHSTVYKNGYYYFESTPRVAAWISYCPDSLQSRAWGPVSGTWFPDAVLQCYWRDASVSIARAKEFH